MERFVIKLGFLLMSFFGLFTIACNTVSSLGDHTSENLSEGNWVYRITEDGEATLLWGDGSEKNENVVMFPAELGGYTVTTLGNGMQNVTSNNKISNNYFLVPTSVESVSERTVYDYNDTAGWVFPGTIETIAENSLLSCQSGTFYIESDSVVEEYIQQTGKSSKTLTADNYIVFTITADDEGYIQPVGTYYLPIEMLNGEYSKIFTVTADYGYQIEQITVDGEVYDFLQGEEKRNEFRFLYNFTKSSSGISVTYTQDSADDRTQSVTADDYQAPDLLEGSYVNNDSLPSDLNEYAVVNGGATAKYTNSMGVSTGQYYAADGKMYKAVFTSQSTDAAEYCSKAEVINGLYTSEGLVYGNDYDLIRLYNYCEEITSGPSQGTVALYCTYVYKEIDADLTGTVYINSSHTNTAALLVQEGAELVVEDLVADVYTGGKGPSEAGNFFGLGSAIHVDGGDAETPAVNTVNEDTAYLKLVSPEIPGKVNSMYALASGVLEITGGDIFSCSSGGHGPYVSTGGQILINTEGTNLISEDGSINIEADSLTAEPRPSSDMASMERNDNGEMQGIFGKHDGDVTLIVTGDEAGTALATDTGGGIIVANQVSTMTYGLRCAGVYSIGFNESWVYTYNSALVSILDAGLVSASGGYIYAYNSDISGVMGIKTRAGGNADSNETGIYVTNSRLSAYYDAEGMKAAYDVADPVDWEDSMADVTTTSDQLNIFLDKANIPTFNEGSLDWWFTDKSLTPGYSGGNKFAVIYVENSPTPVYVESTQLINENYEEYGTLSTEALAEGQTPADNLLVSVESGGTGNITFKNENSRTEWDLTGENDGTCEMVGDFFLAGANEVSDNPNLGSGSNRLNAAFENSEWTGTIIAEDNTAFANLTFDEKSLWTVTGDAVVNNLTLASAGNISSGESVVITVAGTLTINGKVIESDMKIGLVAFVFDADALTEVKNTGGMMGRPPEGMEMPEGMTPPPKRR